MGGGTSCSWTGLAGSNPPSRGMVVLSIAVRPVKTGDGGEVLLSDLFFPSTASFFFSSASHPRSHPRD